MSETPPVLTQAQVDECYAWAGRFLREHVRTPAGDPCPQCGEADLEQHGGKMRCPACHYLQPCCNP